MQTCRFSTGDLDRFNSSLPYLPTLRHSGNHNNLNSFEFAVSRSVFGTNSQSQLETQNFKLETLYRSRAGFVLLRPGPLRVHKHLRFQLVLVHRLATACNSESNV